MGCKKVDIKRRKMCAGDFNKKITLSVRSIVAPETGYDYDQSFTDQTVWAAVQTRSGVQIFDGVNIKGSATHFFYIKYIANVTFENFVTYNGDKYRVIETENLDQRNEYIVLRCALRGDEDFDANLE